MSVSRWVLILGVAAGCASARPVPQESDESVKERLDAEHREAQRDYDRVEAEQGEPQR